MIRHRFNLSAFSLGLFIIGWLAPSIARPAALSIDIIQPDRFASAPATLLFQGTITNNSGITLTSQDLFLNFGSFDPTVIAPVQLLGNTPFTLPDGQTSAPSDLFREGFGASAVLGRIYVTDVTIEDINDNIGRPVRVTVTAIVPEPSMFPLLMIALCFFGLRCRNSSNRMRWPAAAVLLAFATLPASAAVSLSSRRPGIASLNSQLILALPISNDGESGAQNVRVTAITLQSAARITPATLPVVLGAIASNVDATLEATFDASALTSTGRYLLTVQGTYVDAGVTNGFVLNRVISLLPDSPGSNMTTLGSVGPQTVRGVTFPPTTITIPPEVNEPGPPVPTGPLVGNMTPLVTGSGAQKATVSASGARIADSQSVEFRLITTFGNNVSFSGIPPDSSGSTHGSPGSGVVLSTGNTFLAYSFNGGNTFSSLNPTTVFPNNVDGGLCCDQVIQYVPSIDRFIWLMQFRRATRLGDTAGSPTGPNRLRIAAASTQDIINCTATCWTYWDLTSATFGLGNNWMDYPDMSVGTNNLYISVDQVGTGLLVVRIRTKSDSSRWNDLFRLHASFRFGHGLRRPFDAEHRE